MLKFLIVAFVAGSWGCANAADWPPAADYLNPVADCQAAADPANCEYAKSKWPTWYDQATRGEYQGQRNVSFCLSTGCDSAVRANPLLGCAWRFVILESGHLDTDATDTTNLKHFCGVELLDRNGRSAAQAQAKTLLRMLGQ